MIISGKELSNKYLPHLIQRCSTLTEIHGRSPCLHVLLIGNNPASHLYVQMKINRAQSVGIATHVHYMDEKTPEHMVISLIQDLNKRTDVDGILIQLPLPSAYDKQCVLNTIVPNKDVDGLTAINLGHLMQGKPQLAPCTPLGCLQLIHEWRTNVSGLHAVIVGRSTLVGLPLSLLLTQENATVTLCHSQTLDLADYTKKADILVAACGVARLITDRHVKSDACVIDVGSSKTEEGTISGDVDFESVYPLCSAITPVPYGVGPMTVFNLLNNTLKAMSFSLPKSL